MISVRDSVALNLGVAAAAVVDADVLSPADGTFLSAFLADVVAAAMFAFAPLDLAAAQVSAREVSAKYKRLQLEVAGISVRMKPLIHQDDKTPILVRKRRKDAQVSPRCQSER
jgi:hypothetical protein